PFQWTFTGATPAFFPAGASVAQVQAALNGLATIGGVGGSVVVSLSGNTYTVTFGGTLLNQNLPQMTASAIGAVVTVATLQDGLNGNVTVTSSAVSGGLLYTVTFGGDLAYTNLPQMTATPAGGAVVSIATVRDGVNG